LVTDWWFEKSDDGIWPAAATVAPDRPLMRGRSFMVAMGRIKAKQQRTTEIW
jgi:hypothetical protein